MSTQQFKWKDRDTAAQDLLQVVYHAPPSVSMSALNLLGAIRSRTIIPELEGIVLDETREIWQRRYALGAIASVSGEVEMPNLAQHMETAFAIRCKKYHQVPQNRTYNSHFSPDLLDDLIGLADEQPSNREWFFEVLSRVPEPNVASEYLCKSLNYKMTDDFRQQLLDRLLALLANDPDTLTLEVAKKLLSFDTDKTKALLNVHLSRILELCVSHPVDNQLLILAYRWDELRHELIKLKPDFAAQIDDFSQTLVKNGENWQLRKQQDMQLIQENSAYELLLSLYESAKNDDYSAYDRLRKIAKWEKNIPLQAVATHFIGQLLPKHDSLAVLQFQVKYANDDWGNEPVDSPIRFEAGEALSRYPTPEVWEDLVDAFFVKPRNVLESFMQDWITHVTDILSGEQHEYQGGGWSIDNRRWFYALADIDEKSLAKYTNS